MVRGGLGVLGGGIVWYVGFFVLAQAPYQAWPGYASAAQTFMNGGDYEFTLAMSAFNVVLWVLAEIFGGWVTVVVSKRREAAWVLAALLFATMSFMHLYSVWDRMPPWYNIAVVVVVIPAVLLGGRLAGTPARSIAGRGQD